MNVDGVTNTTSSVSTPVIVVCYSPTMLTTDGIWQGINPLNYSLPLFIVQMVTVVLITRAIFVVLKPFRQPRVIAEILSGIVLGPSVLGRLPHFAELMFPPRSRLTLETVAHIGLVYFLFLVGVEMDINVVRRSGRKAMVIALAGMVLPFAIGTSTSFLFRNQISKNVHKDAFLLFHGVALSVTAFPVLARILAETKLLNTEMGRIALSSAIVNDMCAWILLALCVALVSHHETTLVFLCVFLSGIGFTLVCIFVVRPIMWWMMHRIPEGEGPSEFQVSCILTGVMVASFISDSIGIHSVFGAFMFGLVIPNGQLGVPLIEKLEDFVTGLLLPLFFVMSGLKTEIAKMKEPVTIALLVLVYVLASVGRIVGTVFICLSYAMPFNEGITLGFLMNCKGLIEMIILNVGKDIQVLDDESFTVLVLTSLFMTAMVTPAVTLTNRTSRRLLGYKRRNLHRWSTADGELRMLACVHNTRHVPNVVSLLEASNPTKRSPIFVYAIHLVELTGRASSMLIVHNSSTNPGSGHAQSEHIFAAFEKYEQQAGGVSVQTLTAVSPYPTMHEDICILAEDRHVAFIVLPFHKQQTVDGSLETTNPDIQTVNENVLNNAPCSVGIIVDRGFSGASRLAVAAGQPLSRHVALLFFGGPDDREALTYARRMVNHPGLRLTVVRFILGDDSNREKSPSPSQSPAPAGWGERDSRVITIVTDRKNSDERNQDEEYLNEYRMNLGSDDSLMYMERVVSNSVETVAVIREMECNYNLYVVGRGQGQASAMLTAGLSEFSECPELGPIGDLLASSDFAETVSVLVVQQYTSPELDSPAGSVAQYLANAYQRSRILVGSHKGTTPVMGCDAK